MEYISEGQKLLMAEFWTRIYLPIGIWLILIIVLLTGLIWKYPFGNWTTENPNPYSGETLSLPRGIFRSILTLTLLFITVLFELANLYSGTETEGNFIEWITAFQMMIAFYFGSKVMHHVTSADRKKTEVTMEKQAAVYAAQNMNAQSQMGVGDESEDFDDGEAAG
ncbi:MAG: hypothetical protein KAI79_06045 [Bacteroidales bacterium]|nr:hypothetical protein [Bacteroidales bacterium]